MILNQEELREALRRYVKDKDMTPGKLSPYVGVTREVIVGFLKGSNPYQSSLASIKYFLIKNNYLEVKE
jgi:hypothetical protein